MLISAVIRDGDGVLGAVRRSEAGFVVQLRWHVAFDDQNGLAIVVDVKQFWRQRIAAVVALAFLGIEVYSHSKDTRGQSGAVTSESATFSNNVPMLLLPPSEGKAEGGSPRRATWSPDAGSFGARLGDRRTLIVEALAHAQGGNEKLLGVKGEHLLRAQSANSSLIGAAVLPAWQRYTGVVWDHLDPATLPAAAHKQIMIVSGLLGLVRGDDPVPDYRLKMGANLPPFGKLSTWWREPLSEELRRLARRCVVVDLLPQEHRAALVLHGSTGVSLTLTDPTGKPGGHFAKAAKGELARAILTNGLDVIDTWRHPQFDLIVTPL
jgi:cytoplasmic iron level regulating protein YaaA (DUF328/UPF0246 family)